MVANTRTRLQTVSEGANLSHWRHTMTIKLKKLILFIFMWRWCPMRATTSFTKFLDHTQRHTTVCRTPPEEWSARHRDLYLTTHKTLTNIHAPGGIRTHNLKKRAAADLRLRPRGHWDQTENKLTVKISGIRSLPLDWQAKRRGNISELQNELMWDWIPPFK